MPKWTRGLCSVTKGNAQLDRRPVTGDRLDGGGCNRGQFRTGLVNGDRVNGGLRFVTEGNARLYW